MTRARVIRGDRSDSLQIVIPMMPTFTDLDCHICSMPFCSSCSDSCLRSVTTMACCDQPVCAECLAKVSKRCTCQDDCDKIIAYCPYCREISPVTAADLFAGLRGKCCKACDKPKLKSESSPDSTAQDIQ